jgi:glycosyltransferase involved in cell wall biosynthesis
MKIMFFSNPPWTSSGYAKNMKNILPRLKGEHEIGLMCSWGFFGGTIVQDGITIHPALIPVEGGSMSSITRESVKGIDKVMKKNKYDVAILHFDLWSTSDLLYLAVKSPYISYCPVDSDPISPLFMDSIQNADKVVAFCDWAGKVLDTVGVKNTVIPHGVDTSIYKPGTEDKSVYRKKFGIPDDVFLFTLVAMNRGGRKGIHNAMEAYGNFLKRNPEAREKTRMFVSADPVGFDNGYNLMNLSQLFDVAENMIFVSPEDYLTLSEETLADLYRASDVHVLTSHSEGFGIPLIESAACGVPSIATRYTSMTELVEGHGKLVRVAHKELQARQYNYHAMPYLGDIVDAYEKYYSDRDKVKEDGKKAAVWAKEGYDWDTKIIPLWKRFLKEYEEEKMGE